MSAEEGLRARLARQRRDTPAAAARVPVWVEQRLAAVARRRGRLEERRALEPPGAKNIGAPSGLVDVVVPEGRFAARVTSYALAHAHGEFSLGEAPRSEAERVARLVRDDSLRGLALERAIFLDVETTGLSGGAGTISFLVALGTFEDGRFTLWQGFLRGPEEERALLAEVARRIESRDALVTFFGKSFDRHRLEDKMRLHGVAPPFEGLPHLDLFHPLRRLYGAALPDARLQTMERVLCGVARADDLPGSHAPEAWFDFLGQRAHRLEDVLRHNADDVLSLVVLSAHLACTEAEARTGGEPLAGPAAERASALARLGYERREHESALAWVAAALERDAPDGRELELLAGRVHVREREHERARATFERLASGPEDAIAVHALVELAKLEEHVMRRPARALAAARRARELADAPTGGGVPRRFDEELARRTERLVRLCDARAEGARTTAARSDVSR